MLDGFDLRVASGFQKQRASPCQAIAGHGGRDFVGIAVRGRIHRDVALEPIGAGMQQAGPLPLRISRMSASAASETASTSVPSTCRAGMPSDSARALAPAPPVMGPLWVVAEMRLSSHTNNTGSV